MKTIMLPPGIRWLGGLIAEISEKSGAGVQLDTATLKARGGEELIAAVPQARVHELMSGIWSLYSQKGGEWHWTRKGRGDAATYELSQGFKGARCEAMLRAEVDRLWVRHAARMMQAATGTDADRLRLARDDRAVRMLVQLESEESRSEIFQGLAGVKAMLAADTLLRLLSGQQEIIAPVEGLNAGLAESLRITRLRTERLRRQKAQEGFPYRAEPEPDVVTLRVERSGGDLLPSLWYQQALLDAETSRPSAEWGGVLLGGTQATNQGLDDLAALWRLPGDEATPAKGVIPGGQPPPNPPEGPVKAGPPAPDAPPVAVLSPDDARGRGRASGVGAAALKFRIPILARIPWSFNRGHELQRAGEAETLDAYLAPLSQPGSFVRYKWRGPVLLLSQLTWFQPEFTEVVVPWAAVQRLAEFAGHPGASGVEAALSEVAPQLSGRQWIALGRSFPALRAGSEYASNYHSARLLHAIFRTRQTSRGVWTGLRTPDGAPAVEFIKTLPVPDLDTEFRGLRTWPETSRMKIEPDSDHGDVLWRLKARYGNPEWRLMAQYRWPAVALPRDPFIHGLLPPKQPE